MINNDGKIDHAEEAPVVGIHTEASPFELGYQPDSLPKISVPELSDDVQGLSAEALAQVPTLTEFADETGATSPPEEASDVSEASINEVESDSNIQDDVIQADTWGEVLQVRMGKLTQDIQQLNIRLDRIEQRNKTKV